MQELLTTVHAAPTCSCVCQAPHERFEGYWTFKQCISRARGAEFIICKCALWQHSFASACGLLWHASAICSNRLARTICDRLSDNALGCEAAQSVPTRCCTPCSAQHSSLPWRLQSALSLAESGTLLPSSKSSETQCWCKNSLIFWQDVCSRSRTCSLSSNRTASRFGQLCIGTCSAPARCHDILQML